jgi:hypothetical protein
MTEYPIYRPTREQLRAPAYRKPKSQPMSYPFDDLKVGEAFDVPWNEGNSMRVRLVNYLRDKPHKSIITSRISHEWARVRRVR